MLASEVFTGESDKAAAIINNLSVGVAEATEASSTSSSARSTSVQGRAPDVVLQVTYLTC